MACSLCSCRLSSQQRFHCPSCARGSLYSSRLDLAKVLLQKEKLAHQIRALTANVETIDGTEESSLQTREATRHLQHRLVLSDVREGQERVMAIIRQSEILRDRIQSYKAAMTVNRENIATRRTLLTSASNELVALQGPTASAIMKTSKKRIERHHLLCRQLVTDRAYLCAEVAILAGLRRQNHQKIDGTISDSYAMGDVPIMDLRDLNKHTPAEITAALANVSHLLFLVCYYLGLQLPAEIVQPGEQRPHPGIYQVSASYIDHDISNESTTNGGSSSVSGISNQRGMSRPRLLFTEHKPPMLAREDPIQYLKFIQAVVLLGWNVAWLCRTQGLSVATQDWEEICGIGNNLWLLLIPKSNIAGAPQNVSIKSLNGMLQQIGSQPSVESPLNPRTGEPDSSDDACPSLGLLSHSTTDAFLPSAASSTHAAGGLIRSWKFASHIPIVDKLKAHLLAESTGLEWELLDQGEYKGIDSFRDDPLLLDSHQPSDIAHYIGVGNDSVAAGDNKSRGTSGWTKLKSRPSV